MEKLHTRLTSLKSQAGINMVDLMMWLVIAALLLAAALQGIAYYQKAAYLNTMKSDAHNLGANTIAASANNDGTIDIATVNTGAAETKWSNGVTYSVETPTEAGRKPYVRVSNPAVDDKDVIYLFDSCGDNYAVGENVVPKGGTPTLAACGIVPTAPGGGSEYSETDTTLAYTPITTAAAGQAPGTVSYLNTELKWTALKGQVQYRTDWNAEFEALPESVAYYTQYPFEIGPDEYMDYRNTLVRIDYPSLIDLKDAYFAADDAFYNTPTDATHRAALQAMNEYYAAAAATALPAVTPMVPSEVAPSEFSGVTVTAGSTSSVLVHFATPDSLGVAQNKSRFVVATGITNAPSFMYSNSDLATAPTSGSKVLLTTEYFPPPAGWSAGVHELLVGVRDTTTQITHYSVIKITVQ